LTEKKQILKSASIISIVTIFSRILGYVRDQRYALLLGTSHIADSFILAYRIPNLFRRLVGEGSMSASFIPVFAGYMREKPAKEVWKFANNLFWTLALVLAIITVLGMVFSPAVIHTFIPASAQHLNWDEAVALNRIIFPYLFFIGLAALAIARAASTEIRLPTPPPSASAPTRPSPSPVIPSCSSKPTCSTSSATSTMPACASNSWRICASNGASPASTN